MALLSHTFSTNIFLDVLSEPGAVLGIGEMTAPKTEILRLGLAFLARRLSSCFWACCAPLPQSSQLPRRVGTVVIPPGFPGKGLRGGEAEDVPHSGARAQASGSARTPLRSCECWGQGKWEGIAAVSAG